MIRERGISICYNIVFLLKYKTTVKQSLSCDSNQFFVGFEAERTPGPEWKRGPLSRQKGLLTFKSFFPFPMDLPVVTCPVSRSHPFRIPTSGAPCTRRMTILPRAFIQAGGDDNCSTNRQRASASLNTCLRSNVVFYLLLHLNAILSSRLYFYPKQYSTERQVYRSNCRVLFLRCPGRATLLI